MIIKKTHFFLKMSEKIEKLIEPLKEDFGLTSLVYLKSFNDGSEIRLSNRPDWVAHFYKHNLYKSSLFERAPSEYIKSYVPWAGLKIFNDVLIESRKFNIDHGITFIEPCKDGCEFFFFGTDVDCADVMPKYLANIDLLKRFITHFRKKAKSLLTEAEFHKIIIPNKFEKAPKLYCLKKFKRSKFLSNQNNIEFTARELDCVQLLSRGYTQKMIAKELGLSIRTVETHLNHAKDKTQTHSRGELVQYFFQLE